MGPVNYDRAAYCCRHPSGPELLEAEGEARLLTPLLTRDIDHRARAHLHAAGHLEWALGAGERMCSGCNVVALYFITCARARLSASRVSLSKQLARLLRCQLQRVGGPKVWVGACLDKGRAGGPIASGGSGTSGARAGGWLPASGRAPVMSRRA